MGSDEPMNGITTSIASPPLVSPGAEFFRRPKLTSLGSAKAAARELAKSRLNQESSNARSPLPRIVSQMELARGGDDVYFQGYSHVGVHEEMIKDTTRTDTYREAIFKHADFIRGKVVIDVGCGTGILSIFCAKVGARKVYAVDASDIAIQAEKVVIANGFKEVIQVIQGRVEDIEIEEQADVIVSEWMGYMLLYESMLPSVITARNRWLKPGGLMLPSSATLYMAPISNSDRYSDSIDFWRDVYDIDMSPMLPLAKQCAFEQPCIESIVPENVLSLPIVVKDIDCTTITSQELEVITKSFCVWCMIKGSLHGFAFWFDVSFSSRGLNSHVGIVPGEGTQDHSPASQCQSMNIAIRRPPPEKVLVLSTAPEEEPTHWMQTLLYIYDPIEVGQDEVITGTITLTKSRENSRFLNIHLEYRHFGFEGDLYPVTSDGFCRQNLDTGPRKRAGPRLSCKVAKGIVVLRMLYCAPESYSRETWDKIVELSCGG